MKSSSTTITQQLGDDPPFTVQDRRRKGFFTVDNDLYDLYGSQLGPYGLAVYIGLARFANQESESFPSQSTLAKRSGMSRMQVSRELEKLVSLKLVAVEHQFGANGAQRTNLYILLDFTPATDSYTPSNSELHPPVTDSYTPSNSELHKQNISNKTHKEQDTIQQRRTQRSAVPANKNDVVVALVTHGIADSVAQRLAKRYSKKRMDEKIEFLEFVLDERPEDIKKPAAWLRRAIEENYSEPDGYVSKERRERLATESERREAEEAQSSQALKEQVQAKQEAAIKQRRDEYGTKDEDIAFWEQVQQEVKYTMPSNVATTLGRADILRIEDSVVLVGVENMADWRALQHPGTQKSVERTLSQVAGKAVKLESVELKPSDVASR